MIHGVQGVPRRCLAIRLAVPLAAAALAVLGFAAGAEGQESDTRLPWLGRYNVLLICVDDLGCELGCYGVSNAHTPNIDRLAEAGVSFRSAYCQEAICSPSRSCLLTGCRPDTTRVFGLRERYRKALPDLIVFPELFRRSGWTTRALGKVHHGSGELDDLRSWKEGLWRPERWQRYYADPLARTLVERRRKEERRRPGYVPRPLAWEGADAPDGEYPDALIAEEAIRFLGTERKQAFFLAVGFLKPHLPFVAPQKYWDLHPPESIELTRRPDAPLGAPDIAGHGSPELRAFEDVPDDWELNQAMQRELLRGYRACTSFVDAQVGRVLDALEEEGLADRTVVILWGDHGWHLGDLGLWGKHTNYERAVRTPLILSAPGLRHAGASCGELVESVDLYPTVAELCGLEVPPGLEGISFVPLLEEPARPWKRGVFHLFPRYLPGKGRVMGRAMRTATHRVVEWSGTAFEFHEVEVYSYEDGSTEQVNLALFEEHAELVDELLEMLHAGWPAALPDGTRP